MHTSNGSLTFVLYPSDLPVDAISCIYVVGEVLPKAYFPSSACQPNQTFTLLTKVGPGEFFLYCTRHLKSKTRPPLDHLNALFIVGTCPNA